MDGPAGPGIAEAMKIAYGHADADTTRKTLQAVVDQRDRLAAELREARAEIEQLVARPTTVHITDAELELSEIPAAIEADRLRALITAWADADDALIALNGTRATYDILYEAERRSDDALDALRKAVGR